MAETPPERWQDALTRRVRALARLTPLHELEARKGQRDLDLARVDVRALALRVLDLTIEEMGVGPGAARGVILQALERMAASMDPALVPEDRTTLAEAVLGAMLNDGARRQAFVARYVDWTDAEPTGREMAWHLLREVELPDGGYVVQATTEGINVYTGMLEFDVQDAQIAEEAVLRAQIRRGRIEDAVQTARNARLRSVEYQETLRRLLKLAQRDVAQVRWTDQMQGLLDDARLHLEDRVATERELLGLVAGKVDAASDEDAPRVAELRDILEGCQQRHLRLHGEVLVAHRTFLDEQSRQVFRPRAMSRLPDLEAEVAGPALGASAGALDAAFPALLRAFFPAAARRTLYLPQLVDRLLKPPPRQPVAEHVLEDAELAEVEASRPFYEAADHELVEQVLATLAHGPATLSTLLARLRDLGASDRAERLLVLRALHAFEPAATADLRAERHGALSDAVFTGDDLRLERRPG